MIDLLNENDPHVQAALTRACDQCRAPAGEPCVKRAGIHHDLAGRIIHYGRLENP